MEEDITIRYVWMCLITIADQNGIVDETIPALARKVNITVNEMIKAVESLQKTDISSRSPEADGRRLVPIRETFGWKIVNYAYYRDLQSKHYRAEYMKDYMRVYREEKRVNKRKLAVNKLTDTNTNINIRNTLSSKLDRRRDNSDIVLNLFTYWQEQLQHPQARLDASRRKVIAARLKEGYEPERIKQAIRGIKLSPHNMGQNDRNTHYDDIELICRTGKNIDRFADMDGGGQCERDLPDLTAEYSRSD
jgi:hypothetical protein